MIKTKPPSWFLFTYGICLRKRASLPHESHQPLPAESSLRMLSNPANCIHPGTVYHHPYPWELAASSQATTTRAILSIWILLTDFLPLNEASNTALQPPFTCTYNCFYLISSVPSCHNTCAYLSFLNKVFYFLWIQCVIFEFHAFPTCLLF